MIYIINILLGCFFVYLDIHNLNSNLIKWFATFNCFIYLFLKNNNIYTFLAITFALFADYFLLFTNYYLIGICLFILVQLMYMQLLQYHNLFPLIFLVFIFINPIFILALVYLCLSILNLYYSFKASKYFFIAILLLLCCDITIALTYLQILDSNYNIAIWLFYLPSQLCFIYSQSFFQKSNF